MKSSHSLCEVRYLNLSPRAAAMASRTSLRSPEKAKMDLSLASSSRRFLNAWKNEAVFSFFGLTRGFHPSGLSGSILGIKKKKNTGGFLNNVYAQFPPGLDKILLASNSRFSKYTLR